MIEINCEWSKETVKLSLTIKNDVITTRPKKTFTKAFKELCILIYMFEKIVLVERSFTIKQI